MTRGQLLSGSRTIILTVGNSDKWAFRCLRVSLQWNRFYLLTASLYVLMYVVSGSVLSVRIFFGYSQIRCSACESFADETTNGCKEKGLNDEYDKELRHRGVNFFQGG